MPLDSASIMELRETHYNATVVEIHLIHSELALFRVKRDAGPLTFSPGQYTVLGLGYWEPRLPETQPESLTPELEHKLIKRAYSISCRLLDSQGTLSPTATDELLEFYIALVRRTASTPPALTPRLFALKEGDRLHVGDHVHGHYTVDPIDSDQDVFFLATGTGEAPHNAMAVELLARRHRGRITNVTCVRYRRDLGYLKKHRALETLYPNYRYISLTTREPENLDPQHPDYMGKQYLQELVESGELEREAGAQLDPKSAQVYLCGSPDMIGVPIRTHDPAKRYPVPKGMVEVLEQRGFRVDQPHHPGNIHFEKYW
ncbi:MAG: ferredoxin--NADP reductase [Planctomycetaceae bacterium]|nr:ferredoxin--NADP reductase [Planctomycetaceae bacterium]